MTKARFDIYFNSSSMGVVKCAETVILENNGRVEKVGLRYLSDYLAHPASIPLDPRQLALSDKETTFSCSGGIPAFMDDYLPDAWGRKVLSRLAFYRDQRRFNANSAIDTLRLLHGSRIGALSIVPQGELPDFSFGLALAQLAKAEMAAQHVDELDLQSVPLDEMSLLYLANAGSGVGGARPKALLSDEDSANGNHNAKHYLAKFNRLTQDHYNNARVELACLHMAQAAGLEVYDGRIESAINGRELLLLNRFDIADDDSRYHLITVNGLLKENATQQDCGNAFRYDDIALLLKKYSTHIEKDLQQLVSLMIFNRAINNTDDHERNFSLINRGDGYQFAPPYDLVPSLVTGQYHAAGFAYGPNPPTPNEAIAQGKIFGLTKTRVRDCAESVIAAVEKWPQFAEEAGVEAEQTARIARYFHV